MRRFAIIAVAAAFILAETGCAYAARSPVTGFIYTNVSDNAQVTANTIGSKTGRSTATSILGIVATGDCSVATAARQGGIKTITSVDYEITNVLGIYASSTVIVTGQ